MKIDPFRAVLTLLILVGSVYLFTASESLERRANDAERAIDSLANLQAARAVVFKAKIDSVRALIIADSVRYYETKKELDNEIQRLKNSYSSLRRRVDGLDLPEL
jgi:hypothetical protein